MYKIENEVSLIKNEINNERKILDDVLDVFKKTKIYSVDNITGGTVENYRYFIYPFKGLYLVNQKLYQKVAQYLAGLIAKETEVVLTIEADGIGIATLVAAELGLPLIIAKTFHYNEPCLEFDQQTGYYTRKMYLPKIIQGKKVAIIDCLISTGGTVREMVKKTLSLPETQITGIYCVSNKTNYQAEENNSVFENLPYSYLFDTYIKDDVLEVRESNHLKKIFWQIMDQKFFNIAQRFADCSNFSKNGYQVGSIIIDSSTFEIVAWGYRRGHLHAEQDAISMLKQNCPDWEERQLTIYTTLEPCTFRNGSGHTSCSEIIIQIPQIKWVVVGCMDDAEEKINGKGIEFLEKNGKKVRILKK